MADERNALTFRQKRITKPIFDWARKALPGLSETEREAIDSGSVWWDAELFKGKPDWDVLRKTDAPKLTDEEQAFLDGPCEELCGMIDEWSVNWETGDLPPKVWTFIKKKKFFGMIIPKRYGGLGFSAFAHSEIVRRISSRSLVTGVTVMVPNSLGPGELLLQFGTDEQRDHWLPRLARGTEVPAFALTSEDAGSDASAMEDTGVICKGRWKGKEVLGIRLNWSKRYITLGPICTVLGLAFKLRDPDHLLGDEEDIGITCALVPTDLPGIDIGRRHIPSGQMFQNGPNQGKDVFVPLDYIIGGERNAGNGWMMLMSALAAGRGISLPSLSAAAAAISAHSTGAYSRIREQFGIPVGKFEGVQARLGPLAATAYSLDAARRLTCAGLDEGRKLAVISGIMKSNATYRMRDSVDHAMDVHAGKAVISGPKNYLGNLHQSVPIGITVEGANILTRNMIIFGQGAIRCHPYLLNEMLALEMEDESKGLAEFDRYFWAHVGHATKTFFRAWLYAWSGGHLARSPSVIGIAKHYRNIARYSAAFALTSDFALLTLGGSLKRREMLSARLGDVLSELFFLSAALKRWEDDGCPREDLVVIDWIASDSIAKIRRSLDEVLTNMPNRFVAALLRFITVPGGSNPGPADSLTRKLADLLLKPSPTRKRITSDIESGAAGRGLSELNDAYEKVIATEAISRKLRKSGKTLDQAVADEILTEEEAEALREAEQAVGLAVAVDDFAPEELTGRGVLQQPKRKRTRTRYKEAAQ